MLRLCVALFSSVLALPSLAAPQVFVVGLFPGAAVLNVDGQRKLVRVGQTGPQGVQVVSADSRKAVLRIDGVERTYELSREYNEAGYSAPQRQSFSIARGTGGHYWVAGSVNGQNMQFLVDTGATSIAMNENEARRLGIDYRVDGKPMVASTASGNWPTAWLASRKNSPSWARMRSATPSSAVAAPCPVGTALSDSSGVWPGARSCNCSSSRCNSCAASPRASIRRSSSPRCWRASRR